MSVLLSRIQPTVDPAPGDLCQSTAHRMSSTTYVFPAALATRVAGVTSPAAYHFSVWRKTPWDFHSDYRLTPFLLSA